MKKVVIIGGGIIGLSIAHKLAKNNFDITILEKNKVGMEGSWAAAGMLAAQSEFDKYEKFMDFCIKSRDMYFDFCKEIEIESNINVEFRNDGFIIPALNEELDEFLKKKYAWQKNKGFEIELLNCKDLREIEKNLSERIISGLYIKNDCQVNNRKLVTALHKISIKNKIKIIENCDVKNYIIKKNKIEGVETDNGKINADIVINSAGSWASLISQGLIPNFEVKPMLGQMVSLVSDNFNLKKTVFAIMLGKGCYINPMEDSILLGSTMEDVGFNKKVTEEGIDMIMKNCFEIIPELKKLKIKEKWAGYRPITKDSLPIIGKTNIENLILATAHFRNGILLAPITAEAVSQIVVNDKVPDEIKEFGVERFWEKE